MKSQSFGHGFVRIGKNQCIKGQTHTALTELTQRSVRLPIKWFLLILNEQLNFPILTQKWKYNWMYNL